MKNQGLISQIKDGVSGLTGWFINKNYFNESTFVARIRSYQTTAFLVFFISSFLNFISFLLFSYFITSIACGLLVLVRTLIDKKKTEAAYFSLLFVINASLVALVYVEGFSSGIYLFFLPCIVSFAFLTELSSKRNTRIAYLICIGSFIFSFLFFYDREPLQHLSPLQAKLNFYANVGMAFLITGWMSFSLAGENNKRQNTLNDKQKFLNTIFNSSSHGEIVVDMSAGIISEYNDKTIELLRLPGPKSLDGKPVDALFGELRKDTGDEIQESFFKPGNDWDGEITCMRMDGTSFPANVRITSFIYNGLQYKKFSITDITEKKMILTQLEEAKVKAEDSAAAKSQFLSHMSHELRTPLNGIIGATNLLLEDSFLPAQTEQLNILKFSSEHMLSLINDILDLSKLDADKIKLERIPVDINRFISSLITPFLKQFEDKGIDLRVDVSDEIKRSVLADPTRLNQVLTNLISNAFKFTSAGEVTVEVRAKEILSESYLLEFSVTDTGIGISQEKQKTIFDQFTQADVRTTRKYGGTGLGLSISQKLVELMGGELRVDSKYNQGSCFYFEIPVPVYWGKEKVYIRNKLKDSGSLPGLKVLIAEDNPVNMMIATRFLQKWDVKFVKAVNGKQAVEYFLEGDFDIVLMDLEMPEMDGYTAINEIRNINPDIPAIAFTAAVFENMKETLHESGFSDFIQKPFRPEDLYAILSRYSAGLTKTA